MSDIEELKRKKEYLELQREVAALEKKAQMNKTFSMLSYIITLPLALFGLFLVLVGLDAENFPPVVVGLLLIIPICLKFFLGKK